LNLLEYTKEHFRFEEEWMKKSGYKEQEGHKREHTKIINDLVTMY
jgi:hemerythrin